MSGDENLKELENEAMAAYAEENISKALSLFEEILESVPDHAKAKFYCLKIKRTQKAAASTTRRKLFKAQHLNLPKKQSSTETGSDDKRILRETACRAQLDTHQPSYYVPSTRRRSREEMLLELYNQEKKQRGLADTTGTFQDGQTQPLPLTDQIPALSQSGQTPTLSPRSQRNITKKYAVFTPTPFSPSASSYASDSMNASVAPKTPIKVLVVDDSPLMRKVIKRILAAHSAIEIAGEAGDGQQALEQIAKLKPDVITLDVHMPVMDGITTLKHIVAKHHLPVIMLSAYTQECAATTFDCLAFGAVDYISKPYRGEGSLTTKQDEIIHKVINACRLEIRSLPKIHLLAQNLETKKRRRNSAPFAVKLVAIGGGAGGYSSYLRVLPNLAADFSAAIVGIQYMDNQYFDSFCDYLNQYSLDCQ